MITFLVLVGTGIFCKLANAEVKFGIVVLVTIAADIYLTSRFLTLYFGA